MNAFRIVLLTVITVSAIPLMSSEFEAVIFDSYYQDEDDFKEFADFAKEAGATHLRISSSLPPSMWEYDTQGDPYPAWTVNNNSVLKIVVPEDIRTHLSRNYAEKVQDILSKRSKYLSQIGLKAHFHGKDPGMLPEAVFEEHPLWRGARVDHPARSQVARFSPSIDHPEVRALYKESVSGLLKLCPNIDLITIYTNDGGAGLGWSDGLYNGRFGNTHFRDRSMEQRISDFLKIYLEAARENGTDIDVMLRNSREAHADRIAKVLPERAALDNFTARTLKPFMKTVGVSEGYGNPFFPVYGIPQPMRYVKRMAASQSEATRLEVKFSDHLTRNLYLKVFRECMDNPPSGSADEMELLGRIARAELPDGDHEKLLQIWVNIDEASSFIQLLNTGGLLFNLGSVHQRWLTRPFVPYPDELTEEETEYFRKYQMQALPERINSLADLQGTDAYYGWSGRHFVKRVLAPVESNVLESIKLAEEIEKGDLAKRLKIFLCILRNARNSISYQAQLDRVKDLGIKPLSHSVIETQPDWDRQLMMETAREEIDNTALLIELLGNDPNGYLRLAPSVEETEVKLLEPNVIENMEKKLKTMNSKWEDYKRMFTTPNW